MFRLVIAFTNAALRWQMVGLAITLMSCAGDRAVNRKTCHPEGWNLLKVREMIENQGRDGQKIVTIFDDIYNLDDCSAYFRAMDHAGFCTAHHAVAQFRKTRDALARLRGLEAVNVMDFASGYGIAAALMRHDIKLDDVLCRYRDGWFDQASAKDIIAADAKWYGGHRRRGLQDRFAGIDIAARALSYGCDVGIFDAGFAEDLQANAPSDDLQHWLSTCDLIVECGSVAHMLPGALARVLDAAERRPWVITAPIRGNDTAEAIEVMQSRGMVVEVLDVPPFRHRRFADVDEQARAIANARARGHDTDGYESAGYFHAQLFLARPEDEATPVANWP